jgi:ectoine hydroxylase-related dioxygenase (phytanoyl-CoA dioxygenase family)
MLAHQPTIFEAFQADGYCLFERVIPDSEVSELRDEIETLRAQQVSACAPGMRSLLRNSEKVRSLANCDALRDIVSRILSEDALPVRAILFDKTPASNWYVTWHQDFMIAVKERVELEGFGPWSIKDGIAHVQPPLEILQRMVSLRIHLDDCSRDNGAIKFMAGSHARGVLEATQIAQVVNDIDASSCSANRGDVIAMRPLILHSSSRSNEPDHRRVVHIEYSDAELPAGLEWARV